MDNNATETNSNLETIRDVFDYIQTAVSFIPVNTYKRISEMLAAKGALASDVATLMKNTSNNTDTWEDYAHVGADDLKICPLQI